ncbi:MAG: hypothetical protein PHE55_08860 [Methylococcaceae bacterium]|nr:hypothetical protein [Methylococcaceae bacterium]
MTVSEPVAFTTIENAIHAWLTGSTGISWVWAHQAAPQPAWPYGSVSLLSGPIPAAQEWEQTTTEVTHAYAHDLTLTPVVRNSHAYQIYLDSIAITYTSDSSATAKEIVEGLKALIVANVTLNAKLTITEDDATIRIHGKTDATTFTFYAPEGAHVLTVAGEVKNIKLSANVPCTLVFSCQAFVGLTASRSPSTDARSYLAKARAGLELPTYRDPLKAAHIALSSATPIVDISEVVGEAEISRAQFDCTFHAAMSAEDYVTYIQKIEVVNDAWGIDDIYDSEAE